MVPQRARPPPEDTVYASLAMLELAEDVLALHMVASDECKPRCRQVSKTPRGLSGWLPAIPSPKLESDRIVLINAKNIDQIYSWSAATWTCVFAREG